MARGDQGIECGRSARPVAGDRWAACRVSRAVATAVSGGPHRRRPAAAASRPRDVSLGAACAAQRGRGGRAPSERLLRHPAGGRDGLLRCAAAGRARAAAPAGGATRASGGWPGWSCGHPECLLGGCFDVSRLRDAITARLLESGDRQYRRPIGHRPTPLDDLRGGAYSDVGSDDRPRYRQAPEQRMVYLHLGTAGRGNCYEAKAPRTLTIHIRDHEQRTDRTGVYTGYLYVEHHHPAPAGLAARGESPAAFDRRCIPPACVAPRSNTAGIFLRRAVPDGRITSLGAMPDLHHGLLVAASRTWGVSHPF